MIIVELKGGLGNQMFQYAAARALNGSGYVLLDHHFLEENNTNTAHFTARKYALDVFKNISARRLSSAMRKLFKEQRKPYRLIRSLLGSNIKLIRQSGNEYIPLEGVKDFKYRYLDGYFQSEKYFSHIRSQLLHEFSFPELDAKNRQIKEQIINASHSVSVHVRRGDYLKSKTVANIHPVLPVAYYKKAIDMLAEKYPIALFVFSDDPAWARDNIKHDKVAVHYVRQANATDSWKDMALMACCRHHIIANSSFSWWGAWLSEKNGEKLAPYNWFNKAVVDYDIHDFVPGNWTILTYDA